MSVYLGSNKVSTFHFAINTDQTAIEDSLIERTLISGSIFASSIRSYAFAYCYSLTEISFPNCTTIGASAFYFCKSLATVSFPVCTTIGYSAFAYCSSLSSASFPNCTTISASAFYSCRSLTTVSFPNCISIYGYAFQRCYNLLSVYLTSVTAVPYLDTNVFSSTPIGGYTTSTGGVYGSVFVPASLYSSFLTATNWSSIANRIVSV